MFIESFQGSNQCYYQCRSNETDNRMIHVPWVDGSRRFSRVVSYNNRNHTQHKRGNCKKVVKKFSKNWSDEIF